MSSNIIGKAKAMKPMMALIEKLAETKTNVLITGESGTGKELVARAIHFGGPFKAKPFVAVNCGAIPETLIESELFGHKRGSFTGAVSDKDGLFKAADGGTIFLDEVGELPLTMQVKLLRVLQDRNIRPVGSNDNIKIDVRIISATNRSLEEEIAKNRFREDLYYRLNVINIKTPPLRERKEDIPVLVEHFIVKYGKTHAKHVEGISEEAMTALMNYDFPGNVRELENTIERAMALESSNKIQFESLPQTVRQAIPANLIPKKSSKNSAKNAPTNRTDLWKQAAAELDRGAVNLDEIMNELEREFVVKALEKTGGVKKKAAELLGVTFRSMRYRIEKFGITDTEGDVGE